MIRGSDATAGTVLLRLMGLACALVTDRGMRAVTMRIERHCFERGAGPQRACCGRHGRRLDFPVYLSGLGR